MRCSYLLCGLCTLLPALRPFFMRSRFSSVFKDPAVAENVHGDVDTEKQDSLLCRYLSGAFAWEMEIEKRTHSSNGVALTLVYNKVLTCATNGLHSQMGLCSQRLCPTRLRARFQVVTRIPRNIRGRGVVFAIN